MREYQINDLVRELKAKGFNGIAHMIKKTKNKKDFDWFIQRGLERLGKKESDFSK